MKIQRKFQSSLNFVGKYPSNHAPIGNGKVLALIQQYQGGRPIDRIHHILYPYYDREFSLLGEAGIHTVVKGSQTTMRYDFYQSMQYGSIQSEGFISIDNTRYINGTGIYEVESHRGYIRVRTTSWVPQKIDAVVRKIEVSSHLRKKQTMHIYPQVHLKGKIYHKGNIIISRVTNSNEPFFLAVSCPEAKEWHFGDLDEGLEKGLNQNISNNSEEKEATFVIPTAPDLEPQFTHNLEERAAIFTARAGRKPNISFHAVKKVSSRQWSDGVYLVIGFGRSEKEAITNLQQVIGDAAYLYEDTLNSWNQWLASGIEMKLSNSHLNYIWRLSKVILKMNIQNNGLMTYIGFWKYQGICWVRDSVWVAIALAKTGHHDESLQILRALRKIIKKHPNGTICFAYECQTGKDREDKIIENDSAGLLLAGIWYYYKSSNELKILEEFWELIEYCSDWICDTRDSTGMLAPCAGIWEEFSPYEHMVWTSGVSAFGLKTGSMLAEKLGKPDRSKKYYKVYKQLLSSIKKYGIKDGILCRSVETGHLDSSVLVLFSLMPLFGPNDSVVLNTIHAIEERLVDPILGGVWRHEEAIWDRGDTQPWHGCTLWLAEAYLALGKTKEAWKYIQWTLDNSSYCGLMPEEVLVKGILGGIAMPSFSQGGFLMAMMRYVKKV